MTTRATIVAAAVTDVGKVREHNEDASFIDADRGVFMVCDGMGGHAAGEVASALAVAVVRERWLDPATTRAIAAWNETGTADARRALLGAVRDGVHQAHGAIASEAAADERKRGMGTTFVGVLVSGGDAVVSHAGDSRAYLVRGGIAVQLTEDHTLLSRLLAAGIDVDVEGDGARFKTMLTNALGIGEAPKASTTMIPLCDGDRLLLCSDGVSEYVTEVEVGEVLSTAPSPARAAHQLVDRALERGGHDNATAVVLRILEAGASARAADQLRRDDVAAAACPLLSGLSPQRRMRALRIAVERDLPAMDKVPAHLLSDRVAWIVLDGEAERDGRVVGPGALLYPESLVVGRPSLPGDRLYVVKRDLRAMLLRCDDFQELCEDDSELAEALLEGLTRSLAAQAAALGPGGLASERAPTPPPLAPEGGTNGDGVPAMVDE